MIQGSCIHLALLACWLLLGVDPLAAEQQSFIANGDAEKADADGGVAGWSIYVRKGTATLTQTKADKSEGAAAARLELQKGANFDVRIGRPIVPKRDMDATYLFSADIKISRGRHSDIPGYFAIGTDSDLHVGRLGCKTGWHTIHLKIPLPANETIRRLEFSGGSQGPAVVLIDNVRLTFLREGLPAPAAASGDGAMPLKPGAMTRVKKILPTDCRLVRRFLHAPVDGRVDTRYATGAVSEFSSASMCGVVTGGYGPFNGINGLHVTLADDRLDALQVRGGWLGRVYADVDTLTPPTPDVSAVCEITSQNRVFRHRFDTPVKARRLSFFFEEDHRQPLADMTFLQVENEIALQAGDDDVTLHLGEPASPAPRIDAALRMRFGEGVRVHRLENEAGGAISLKEKEYVHLITPPQNGPHGIDAISLQLHIAEVEQNAVLTVRVHDVLDARREAMGVDFQVSGPGTYTITMDVPDQVFLPSTEGSPRLDGGIAPPPVLWVSLAGDSPMRLQRAAVTIHRVPREMALVEAGAWRKFLLKGLFASMSEPRPWMHLVNGKPVREQIETNKAIERYKIALLELLETAEIARLLMPDDDIVRQYHNWLYQNMDRRKPQPPADLPNVAGAPRWAVAIRENWREVSHIARWWLDNRLVANGELGGHIGDDTDMFQTWQCLSMIESEPLGSRLKDAGAQLSDLAWELRLDEGLNRRTMDPLHAYEEGLNQLALCAWWFYGDPVHYERVMISARSVAKLMVTTDDGRVHFGGKYVGVDEMRNGFKSLGKTPGDGNWCPIRFMLHPVYVAAMYNRHPVLTEKFERWGKTWRDYQQHGAYVGQVDIATGKPTIVSKKPSAAGVGPVNEWLALYQITGDPKWQEPFEFMMDSKGYWGTSVQYGRMPHTLVEWESPYQQTMRSRITNAGHGYAGFFLHQDRSYLEQWLDISASWFGRYRHMHTAAEQKTDRVLNYNATTAISCYLGDAPNRNRWLNFTAVSYERLRGEDFAALVWNAGRDRLRVALYNFQDKPLDGLMRVWRLDHGFYNVTTGPDADDDGSMDAPADERVMALQRYATIPVTLAPQQVTIVSAEQIEQLDDIADRADVALSSLDTHLSEDGTLTVNVHNIGAKPAHDVVVALVRDDRTVASQTIDAIAPPIDLEPKIVALQFSASRPGDVVVVDPEDNISEIAEHNNRLAITDPAQPGSTN